MMNDVGVIALLSSPIVALKAIGVAQQYTPLQQEDMVQYGNGCALLATIPACLAGSQGGVAVALASWCFSTVALGYIGSTNKKLADVVNGLSQNTPVYGLSWLENLLRTQGGYYTPRREVGIF